jgi:hypothetical protein
MRYSKKRKPRKEAVFSNMRGSIAGRMQRLK